MLKVESRLSPLGGFYLNRFLDCARNDNVGVGIMIWVLSGRIVRGR